MSDINNKAKRGAGDNMSNKKKSLFGRKKAKRVNYSVGETGSKKNLILVATSTIFVVVIAAAIFFSLSVAFSTEEYYVLNTNVRAKEQITPDMLTARETSKDTGPSNALTMEQIQRGRIYARYPLYAGDVVATSNAGPAAEHSLGIPDDWIVTSFSISSENAVGGTLGRGDYVDLIGVDRDEGARYIFNNILLLEVKFLDDVLDGNMDGQTVLGETLHYTVGMPADAVGYLHSALNNYATIKIVKSPVIIKYADRDVSNLDQPFLYDGLVGNIDLIKGTDPTFTAVERDEFGKPIVDENILEIKDNKKDKETDIVLEDDEVLEDDVDTNEAEDKKDGN